MTNIIHVTRLFSENIQNGRTLADVISHLKSEVAELEDEVNGANGADGIVGECVDVILCALDAIFIYDETVSDEQIEDIVVKKLGKWRRRYENSVEGDRTID